MAPHLNLDMVVNVGSGSLFLLLGNGDGTFQIQAALIAGANAIGVIVGDFDGDGNLDLGVANSGSNNASVLLGNGDGSFQPTAVQFGADDGVVSVAMGDFNGDGKLDLAVANNRSNNVSVLLNNTPSATLSGGAESRPRIAPMHEKRQSWRHPRQRGPQLEVLYALMYFAP